MKEIKRQNSCQANREGHILRFQTRKVKSLTKTNANEIIERETACDLLQV